MAVIKYGLYGCRLAAATIPVMTEESISLLFLGCMDRFVSEQHAVPPAKGLSAIHYRAADRHGNRKPHTIFKQYGDFFFKQTIPH